MRWLEEDGHVDVFRKPSNFSNGNTFDWQGRQLSCEHQTRRLVRYEQTGEVTVRRLSSNPVSHPAIVQVLDAGLEGMSAYLAMEYVTAETLDVALRHLAPAPLDRALPILTELAGAIDAAWAAGVGHGSLHPRDVFVGSGTHEVRVTGFGVAPALEAVGIRIPPRRPYAAPERGTSEAWDVRADIYSLGVLAHELLTKRRPGGANEQDGSLVTGTSPEARALIRKVLAAALADRPEHRFASAGAFANALTAIVKGEPLGALPEGASVSEEKPPAPKKHEPPPLLDDFGSAGVRRLPGVRTRRRRACRRRGARARPASTRHAAGARAAACGDRGANSRLSRSEIARRRP